MSMVSSVPPGIQASADKRRLVADMQNRLLHHAPKGDQADRYEVIRRRALRYAEDLIDLCPQSRELSLALGRLEEVVFYALGSIARNE